MSKGSVPVEVLEQHKNPMFATHKSLEQVIERYNVRGADVAILMIAVNTAIQEIINSHAVQTS